MPIGNCACAAVPIRTTGAEDEETSDNDNDIRDPVSETDCAGEFEADICGTTGALETASAPATATIGKSSSSMTSSAISEAMAECPERELVAGGGACFRNIAMPGCDAEGPGAAADLGRFLPGDAWPENKCACNLS